MRLDTVINKSNKLRATVTGIMQYCIRQRHSHTQIIDRVSRAIYQDENYQSLPRYAQNRINGYVEGYFDAIWNNCVTWHVKFEGEYTLGDDIPSGRWNEVEPGAMLWNGTKEVYS